MFIFLMHVFTLNCNARIHITLRRCFSQSNAQKNKKKRTSDRSRTSAFVAGAARLELATYGFGDRRSTN